MEFKGTKGGWEYTTTSWEGEIEIWGTKRNHIIAKMVECDNTIANALLISKAPEMLEEHQTDIDQLEAWIEWLEDLEKDEKYIGIIGTMKKRIDYKRELIKSATEL